MAPQTNSQKITAKKQSETFNGTVLTVAWHATHFSRNTVLLPLRNNTENSVSIDVYVQDELVPKRKNQFYQNHQLLNKFQQNFSNLPLDVNYQTHFHTLLLFSLHLFVPRLALPFVNYVALVQSYQFLYPL